ncbi:hypothetical protein TNCV_3862721 [Trichonephila clavipes]|uniref:Uncharacterized protein n=1 Tax=Trichonephila clavipes TaxID=2585209 RepID=A0A8X6SAW8_TRICX|nr:hypothetical protein TNCV_3862721 [Trichonephila clavipes]
MTCMPMIFSLRKPFELQPTSNLQPWAYEAGTLPLIQRVDFYILWGNASPLQGGQKSITLVSYPKTPPNIFFWFLPFDAGAAQGPDKPNPCPLQYMEEI